MREISGAHRATWAAYVGENLDLGQGHPVRPPDASLPSDVLANRHDELVLDLG
jgi:hypothetical protein